MAIGTKEARGQVEVMGHVLSWLGGPVSDGMFQM